MKTLEDILDELDDLSKASRRLLREARRLAEAERPLPTDRDALEALLRVEGWYLDHRANPGGHEAAIWIRADAEEDPRGMSVTIWWGPLGRAEYIYRGSAEISTLGGVR